MTPKVQRIGILVIAVVMVIGTLGSFALLVLANDNAQTDYQRQAEEQRKELEKQQKETDELSAKYYPAFKEYQNNPAPFDAAVGDKVTYKDLKVGDGATITKESDYRAYYIGWNPKGKVFDSSFDGDKLKAPLEVSFGRLIPGWYEGVEGMKVGGVREITIPSDLAYRDADMGDNLPPNTPIKFIVMVASKS